MEATPKQVMKKVFILLMFVALSVVANAQLYVGGTLGVGVEHGTGDYGSATVTTFTVAPEVGYNFNKTWAVGGTVGVQYMDVSGTGVTTLSILPYVRATFARAGIFDFFGELTAGYGYQTSGDYGVSGFVAGLRPGFVAHVSNRFGLVGKMNLFKFNTYDGESNVGFSINNGIELGVQFSF